MQWSECLCYICLKIFVDKERKNTCIKRAVGFVFTWRTKVPDATTDRNCLISLILSFFDALWTTAQYVQGCQQDHLWCRHYCNKTVENFFFNDCLTNIFAVSELKKSLVQVLLLKVTNFKDFQFTSVMFWCTKHGIYFFSVFCNSHRSVTYSCCKKLSYKQ